MTFGQLYCWAGWCQEVVGFFLDRSPGFFVSCTQPMPGTPPGSLRACSRFRLRRPSPGCVPSDLSSVRPVCSVTVSVHFMPGTVPFHTVIASPDSGRRSSGSEALRSPCIGCVTVSRPISLGYLLLFHNSGSASASRKLHP
jgi:hypothetical protein